MSILKIISLLSIVLFSSSSIASKLDIQEKLLQQACQNEQVVSAHIGNKKINLLLACTDNQQMYGLMFRKFIPENDGMLFIFNKDQKLDFWMKDTLIPLSIAYLNNELIIKEMYNMQAEDLTVISSHEPLRYALEMNLNWYKKNNITIGQKLVIDDSQNQSHK